MAGGLVGEQRNADISQSYSKGNVYNSNDGESSFAGGITGFLSEGAGKIEDCYSLGNVTAEYPETGGVKIAAGGILGTTYHPNKTNTNFITIRHCYAAGTVQAINHSTHYNSQSLSGGITGEVPDQPGDGYLVNNVFLGPFVINQGSRGQYTRLLYAVNPRETFNNRGYWWDGAVKWYTDSTHLTQTIIVGRDYRDGTEASNSVINSSWASWGYGTAWSTSLSNAIGTTGINAPKLAWEP
jgi:hypothetical protein